MRIVVVGAGKLGYSIAALLSKEQFDVIVIDHDESQLEAVKNTLDVLTIFANGASPITMNDPDIRGADILIAVTASDEVNMVACILAKKHGIRHTIARIRDMQFMSEAKDYLKENFDIDLMLNPELITANEINRILNDAGRPRRRGLRARQDPAVRDEGAPLVAAGEHPAQGY